MKKVVSLLLLCGLVCALFAGCNTFDPSKKSEGVMTYAQYDAAALDTQVTLEVYVQAHQSWWDGKLTVYAQDPDGGYFIYNMAVASEADAAKLVKGTKIRVTGTKTEWSGEVELAEGATYEIVNDGTWIAKPTDVTALLKTADQEVGTEDHLQKHINQLVSFKGLKVVAKEGSEDKAFYYSWDNSGSREANSDLYFDVELDGKVFTFTVESYLMNNETDVYKAVEALKVGDTIDIEAFLYWYNGANPHVTSVTVH